MNLPNGGKYRGRPPGYAGSEIRLLWSLKQQSAYAMWFEVISLCVIELTMYLQKSSTSPILSLQMALLKIRLLSIDNGSRSWFMLREFLFTTTVMKLVLMCNEVTKLKLSGLVFKYTSYFMASLDSSNGLRARIACLSASEEHASYPGLISLLLHVVPPAMMKSVLASIVKNKVGQLVSPKKSGNWSAMDPEMAVAMTAAIIILDCIFKNDYKIVPK